MANGDELSYAWFLQLADGSIKSIADASGNVLTLNAVVYELNGAQVYCVITSSHGEQTESFHANMVVEPKLLVITSDLVDVSVIEGDSVNFNFGIEGDVDQYTWYLQQTDGTLRSTSCDDGSYTLTNANKSLDGSTIWCVATGIHGQTIESSKIKLTVLSKSIDKNTNDHDSTSKSYGPKDTNQDGVTTCSEAYGNGWIWDESQSICILQSDLIDKFVSNEMIYNFVNMSDR